MVPGVGEVFDGANAAIYAARGDTLNAALSASAMIPMAGNAATAAKLGAKYGDEAVGAAKAATASEVFSIGARGVEPASDTLLGAVQKHGREIFQDAESQRRLDRYGANASSIGEDIITLRPDPRKIEVLEEFLHGTQHKLGLHQRMNNNELERHVKGFMIRHKKLLGISEEDVRWLEASKARYE